MKKVLFVILVCLSFNLFASEQSIKTINPNYQGLWFPNPLNRNDREDYRIWKQDFKECRYDSAIHITETGIEAEYQFRDLYVYCMRSKGHNLVD